MLRCAIMSLVVHTLVPTVCAFFTNSSAFAQPPDFSRDILPILSDKCFHCHGPDAKARKAGLRLDTREGAFRVKDGKTIIIPGKSQESELIRRILAADTDEVMPPADAHRPLTNQQKELLKKWIESGASWEQHWAFTPLRRPVLPEVSQQKWVKDSLDRFILSKLEKAGLTPNPPAPKELWLRRVTFDLTGLPATLAELDAYLQDSSANAEEKVVDRLLASPRYGERMATDWLDLARYADTHGYQMDRYRSMWPYRDWVIKAFNQNLPFDQFVTWQLAGDLLPHPTKDQRLATAFNRLHLQNEEGGVVEEEFRVSYVVDRVNTFGTAFLGLTLDCSRCHDHKYDPITMRDYYSLFAFFQNIDESGQTTYFTNSMPVPTLLLSDPITDQKLEQIRQKMQALSQQQARVAADPKTLEAFTQWLKTKPASLTLPNPVAYYPLDEFKDNLTANIIHPQLPAKGVESPQWVPGKVGQAIALDGENGLVFPQVGHFNRTDRFSLSFWLKSPAHSPRMVVLHHSKAPVDAGSRGYEVLLENGKIAFGLHHMWPGNSLKVATQESIPTGQWVHVALTYDGSSVAAGALIYINGKAVATTIIRDGLYKDITYGGEEPALALGHRFRDNGFKGGQVDELRIFDCALSPLQALALADPTAADEAWSCKEVPTSPGDRVMLLEHFLTKEYPPAKIIAEQLHALRKEENQIVNPIPEAMVMRELPQPKPAFVLKRGAYDARGESVPAAPPKMLPPMPTGAPANRLGLAQWLLQPGHPLTARVTVNRFWQQMFGAGLVETSDNLGTQGSRPINQELLDWLACEFQSPSDSSAIPWDIKHFLKKLALSATYRQSSQATQENMAKDAANQWLSRYPARRLSAEMLRDQALALSGLLVEKQGGPSVKPYQPEGLWEVAMGNPRYDRGKGPDLYRRSLYTFWKRTVPPPAMVAFDAAERNVCSVRRQSTSTPLQALALLNDVQYVEAAKLLGEKIQLQPGSLAERVRWAYRHVTCRLPSDREVQVLMELWRDQKDYFEKNPAEAQKLLTVGDAKIDSQQPAPEIAASTILAQALLNQDAAVMRR